MQTGILVSLALYFVLMLAIGVYAWRKSRGQHTSVISTSTDEPDERGLHK